ncbi:hypothetical protein SAMN04244576_06400 [Sinorhizobium meliloti]|nr:hypothetical protein SAMN04244576_06400 [Sinorhizobium meliloti]
MYRLEVRPSRGDHALTETSWGADPAHVAMCGGALSRDVADHEDRLLRIARSSSRFVPPCHSPSMNITRSTLCRTNGRKMLLTLPVVTNSAWILGATRVRYSTQWLQVGDEYSMRVTGAEMLPMGVSGRPAGARSLGLSGILCGGPVSSVEEPLAKDDGELCLCLDPFPRRPFPLLGRVVKNEI